MENSAPFSFLTHPIDSFTFDDTLLWDDAFLAPSWNFETTSQELKGAIDVAATEVVAAEQNTTAAEYVVAEEKNNTIAAIDEVLNEIFIKRKPRVKRTFRDPTTISKEMISRYFHLPIGQAANELQVGQTVLKKRCREVGISRWPQHKLLSLERLSKNVQEFGSIEEEAQLIEVVNGLEGKRGMLLQNPNLEVGEALIKLRERCSRNSYKKRRFGNMMDPTSSSTLPLDSPHTLSFTTDYDLTLGEIDDVLEFLLND